MSGKSQLKARGKVASTPSTPNLIHSAARAVYDIPELRQRIIGLLAKTELKEFMRVSKRGMYDVAVALYYSVTFWELQYKIGNSTERQRMYLAAITEVRITWDQIPDAMYKDIVGHPLPAHKYRELEPYRPDLCKLLILTIREKCPGVCRIYWGKHGAFGREAWVVHCFKPNALNPSQGGDDDTGLIEVIVTKRPHLFSADPPSIIILGDPPTGYRMQKRFDLNLVSNKGADSTGSNPNSWLKFLRESPQIGDLYTHINLHRLPVTIHDLTMLYEKQIVIGHRTLLQHISSSAIAAYSIDDFLTFAKVSRSSLTTLFLEPSFEQRAPAECADNISFDDLALLLTSIRHDLPNLTDLQLSIAGIEGAESACRDLLASDTLELRGKLVSLRFTTSTMSFIPFNLLRSLSPLLAEDFHLSVGRDSSQSQEQMAYVALLRSQNEQSRPYLSTVNFPSLGLSSLSEVEDLQYRPHGEPKNLAVSLSEITFQHFNSTLQARRSINQKLAQKSDVPFPLQVDILNHIQACYDESSRLFTTSRTGLFAEIKVDTQSLMNKVARSRDRFKRASIADYDVLMIFSDEVEEDLLGVVRACEVMEALEA